MNTSTALERNAMHETCSGPRPFVVGRGGAVFGRCQKVTQAKLLQHWFHNVVKA